MNRREFAGIVAGTAVLGALRPAAPAIGAAAGDTVEVSEAARSLYPRSLVLDCNSSPPLPERLPMSQPDLDLVRGSGIDVIKLTLGGINDDFAHTVASIARVQQLIEVHPDYFTQVRTAADMARAQRERKLGIIFSF